MRSRLGRRLDAIEFSLGPPFPQAWHRWRATGELPAHGSTAHAILRLEHLLAAADCCNWGVDVATMTVDEELPGWTEDGRAELQVEIEQRVRRAQLCLAAFEGDADAGADLGRAVAAGGVR